MNAFFKLVLKGSAVSALALFAAATGCSDSGSDDEPGAGGDSGNHAGSSNQSGSASKPDAGAAGAGATTAAGGAGGTPEAAGGQPVVAGGADAGGADAGGADAGGADTSGAGAGGADGGVALAKFCNSLTFGTEQDPEDTTMILEVGEGANKVTFTASTGECVPADGAACTPIPTGADVLIQMFDADAPGTALDSSSTEILDGEQYFIYTDLDNNGPFWAGNKINQAAATCDEFTYDDVP